MSEPTPAPAKSGRREPTTVERLLIDVLPLVVFFGTYFLSGYIATLAEFGIFYATGAFMAAMIIAIIYSQIRLKHVSPVLLFSGVVVVVMGGITLWLHDATFIKMKPTIIYSCIAVLLLGGLMTGRNFLQLVLGTVYPGLTQEGWSLLTRNWIGFFLGMAVLNEVIWRTLSDGFWLGFKIWFTIPATFLFAVANVPMLMKHGLDVEADKDKPDAVPPVE